MIKYLCFLLLSFSACVDKESISEIKVYKNDLYYTEFITANYNGKIDTIYYFKLSYYDKSKIVSFVKKDLGYSLFARVIIDSALLETQYKVRVTIMNEFTNEKVSDGEYLIGIGNNNEIMFNDFINMDRIRFLYSLMEKRHSEGRLEFSTINNTKDSVIFNRFSFLRPD